MSETLTSVRVAGALLPSDVVSAVLAGTLDGLSSSAYHLGGESPREAAARVWTHLTGVYRRFRDELERLPEDDPAVGLTRERWLTVLLSELGYGRVPTAPAGGLVVSLSSSNTAVWKPSRSRARGRARDIHASMPNSPRTSRRVPRTARRT